MTFPCLGLSESLYPFQCNIINWYTRYLTHTYYTNKLFPKFSIYIMKTLLYNSKKNALLFNHPKVLGLRLSTMVQL